MASSRLSWRASAERGLLQQVGSGGSRLQDSCRDGSDGGESVGVRHERAEFVRRIEPFPIAQARAKGDDRVQRPAGFDELQIQIAAQADKGRTVHGHAVDGYVVVVLDLEDDDAMRRAVADIDNAGKRGQHGDLAERQRHDRARGMEIREIQGHAARLGDKIDRPEGVDVGKLRDRKRP